MHTKSIEIYFFKHADSKNSVETYFNHVFIIRAWRGLGRKGGPEISNTILVSNVCKLKMTVPNHLHLFNDLIILFRKTTGNM